MGFPWGFHGKFLMVSVKQLVIMVHQQLFCQKPFGYVSKKVSVKQPNDEK